MWLLTMWLQTMWLNYAGHKVMEFFFKIWLGFTSLQHCKCYLGNIPALLMEEDLRCPSVHKRAPE